MEENKIPILSLDKFGDDSYLQLDNSIKGS